jgi:TonB family protein
MNWQTFFGRPDTADWILLTAFHSLWISLAVLLVVHIRKFRAPAVRSTWCAFTIILLLILPLITWFVPQTTGPAHPDQKPAARLSAATADAAPLLLNSLLDMGAALPQARINQWKVPLNQFGLIWLAVTLICVGRLLYQLAFLKGYCTGLQIIEDDRISLVLQDINRTFGFRKKPRFFISPILTSPVSMGIRTPLVVLPASLYQSISDDELRAILLHELAHIYNYDHVLGLLQRLVKALYWWNPLVHRLSNTMSVAREEVSDNYAISGMESAANYATLLVGLIEKTSLINSMPCTAGMETPFESLKTRIRNIVSKERDMRVKADKGMVSAVVFAALLMCGLVGVGSQVKLFGIGQATSGSAKPIGVTIKFLRPNFDMDSIRDSVLVLEAALEDRRYQSTPIVVNGNEGSCDFPDPVPPGQYKLIYTFTYRQDVTIPPTPHSAASLHIYIEPERIRAWADIIQRNENAQSPQTTPIKLDPSELPVILSRVDLEYPPDARFAKISGTVKAEVIVNANGEVYEARLMMSHPWFAKPGLDAILRWKFQPLLLKGQPTPFVTTVNLDFKY